MQRILESAIWRGETRGGMRARPAALLRRIALAGAFLAIQAPGPETARAMQEQPAPGCIVVSPAEPDRTPYAQSLQRQTVLAATGMDLLGMANAWLHRPAFAVRYESASQMLRVSIEEIPDSARTPATYPIQLALEAGALGVTERFDVTLRGPSEAFDLPFPYRPRFVAVRPEEPLPMQVRIDQSAAGWVAQLRHASFPASRLAAAEALRILPPDPALIIGLRTALGEEPSSRVRAAIAQSIARLALGGAADRALAAAYEDPSAEVRKAVFASLDQARGKRRIDCPNPARRAIRPGPGRAGGSGSGARQDACVGGVACGPFGPDHAVPGRNHSDSQGLTRWERSTHTPHGDTSGEDAEDAEDEQAAGEATRNEALPEIPAAALTEGLQFATSDGPLPLRKAARRLFLRIRQYEPTATYGAPFALRDLQPCP